MQLERRNQDGRGRSRLTHTAAGLLVVCGLLTAPSACASEPELVSVRKIWDAAPHNAFTDLVRHNGTWYCSFREAAEHAVSVPGSARVIRSTDGETWTSAALFTSAGEDFRDPHLTITPDNRLMLYAAAATPVPVNGVTHRNYAWFSADGTTWTDRVEIGEPNIWLWRITWHQGTAYGIGYAWQTSMFIRLYTSTDGVNFQTLVPDMGMPIEPNETSRILFMEDGRAYVLAREGAWGTATPPYTQWTWRPLGFVVGGPEMIRLPDGRFIAASRLSDGSARTSLSWGDPVAGTLFECLTLPSGGDTSYPGMVWHDDRLWVSYYSSHEGKTSIYLAQVAFPPPPVLSVEDNFNRSDGDDLGTTQAPAVAWTERSTLGGLADVARIRGGQLEIFGTDGPGAGAAGPGAAVLDVDMPDVVIAADVRFEIENPAAAAGSTTGGFMLRRSHPEAGIADAPGLITVQIHPGGGLYISQIPLAGGPIRTLYVDNPFVSGQQIMDDVNRFFGPASLPTILNGMPFDADADGVLESGEPFRLTAVLAGRSLEVRINDASIASVVVEGLSSTPANAVALFKNRWTANTGDAAAHVLFDNLVIMRDGGMLWEDFESGVPGACVAGTRGWTGNSFLTYSATGIDQGQSAAGRYDVRSPSWPRISKTFLNTVAAGQRLEWTATMWVANTWGDYMHLELRQTGTSGDRGVMKVYTGYGTLDFFLYGMDGSNLFAFRPSQVTSPVDVKVVLREGPYRTDCYYRLHGTTDWTYVGGADAGLALAGYDRVEIAGHNYGGGAETGIVDSIRLAAVGAGGAAGGPSPANGASGVSTTAQLSWTAAASATSHDVYFGTISPPPFIRNQTATTFDPGVLTYSTTYYWRIDERGAGGTVTGDVWSFTTQAQPIADGVVFVEEFESGAAGTPVAGGNGWTGDSYLRYSATTIDQGQSAAGFYDASTPPWPRITRLLANPIGSRRAEFSATMRVRNTHGDYAHVELRQAGTVGEQGIAQLFMGYGTMDFRVWSLDGSMIVYWRINAQPDVPVDLKLVLEERPARTDCYWRLHGETEWTWVGGTDAGLPLAGYDRVEVAAHNYNTGAETGHIDSIRLTAIATCATPAADADADGDVDLEDFSVLQACFNGPNRPHGTMSPACQCLDDDADGDIDMADFGAFQACFNGPNRPPACP